jgi:hypothetical protein
VAELSRYIIYNQSLYDLVILSQRSESKDLRTDYLHYSIGSA